MKDRSSINNGESESTASYEKKIVKNNSRKRKPLRGARCENMRFRFNSDQKWTDPRMSLA